MHKFFFIGLIFMNTLMYSQSINKLSCFHTIDIFGKIDVKLIPDSVNTYEFKSGNDYKEKIKFSVEDSVLQIKMLSEFPAQLKARIYLSYKNINSLTIGGGANITNKDTIRVQQLNIVSNTGSDLDLFLKTDSVNLKIKNGGFVRLSGYGKKMNLKMSIGGLFRAEKFNVENCVAVLNGGDAEVKVENNLNATVRLGGLLKYTDKPLKIKETKFGGKILPLETY